MSNLLLEDLRDRINVKRDAKYEIKMSQMLLLVLSDLLDYVEMTEIVETLQLMLEECQR